MKTALFLACLLLTFQSFAQNPDNEPPKLIGVEIQSQIDPSSPRVVYQDNSEEVAPPACFVNGNFIHYHQLKTIDPQQIATIDVLKETMTVEEVKYHGRLNIQLKEGYEPAWMTLSELREKYLEQTDSPAIFLLDEEVINEAADEFRVDENYILQIKVSTAENSDLGHPLQIIHLWTRTKKNIDKLNTILIRGS